MRLIEPVPVFPQSMCRGRKYRCSLSDTQNLSVEFSNAYAEMNLERTVAERMAKSSIARRRTTAALVKTRPATHKVDRSRQTMEQMLTTGLKLVGEMVT